MTKGGVVSLSFVVGAGLGALLLVVMYGLDWVFLHNTPAIDWSVLAITGAVIGVVAGLCASLDIFCLERVLGVLGAIGLTWLGATVCGFAFEILCAIVYDPPTAAALHYGAWEIVGDLIGGVTGLALGIVLIDQMFQKPGYYLGYESGKNVPHG